MLKLHPNLLYFVLLSVTATPAIADTLEAFTEPFRKVDVAAGEPGVITEIHVEPGQVVRQGEELLAFDTSVLRAALDVARQRAAATGAVAAAKAEWKLRRERLAQIEVLRQRGHATQRELQRAEADAEIAAAKLRLAEEERVMHGLDCKRIEAQIATRIIRSPMDAVVADVHREVGEAFLITDPRIVTLVQLDQLRARFPATPAQALRLSVGQTVSLTLPDQNEKRLEGRVDRIAPIIDAKSGTLEVSVVLANHDRRLRSGSRCLLRIESDPDQRNSLAADSR